MGGPWVAHMLHFTRHRSLNGPYSLRCIARGIAPPPEELKRAGSEKPSQPFDGRSPPRQASSFPSDRPRLSYAFRRGGTMTIPTDPYNSPQRRPFDEGHILKPLCEERPKAADFGHSTATRPDAKRPDTKGRADARERTDAIEGAGTNE